MLHRRRAIREGSRPDDPNGYLLDLDEWSTKRATKLAANEGIQMTAKHWEVVRFLREQYRRHGAVRYAHEVVQLLESKYAHEGGRKLLNRLFPHGPVHQASRIAGLPVPPRDADPTIGAVP